MNKEQHIYHEDLQGSVSWKTADTGESIPVYGSARDTFPVFLLCPDGSKIEEESYRGRGQFGGQDVNALLANWNWPEQCTGDPEKDAEIGKENVWRHPEAIKFPIKLVRNPELNYEDVDASESCEFDGWDYEIEDTDLNCFELNKYSKDKVIEYFNEQIGDVVECSFERGESTVAEATYSMLDIYGDGWDTLIYVLETLEKQYKIAKGHYAKSYELTFWIPEEDLNNFINGALFNGYPVKIISRN